MMPVHERALRRMGSEVGSQPDLLRRALGVQLHAHVLDIGCGTGQTTREAARTAQVERLVFWDRGFGPRGLKSFQFATRLVHPWFRLFWPSEHAL